VEPFFFKNGILDEKTLLIFQGADLWEINWRSWNFPPKGFKFWILGSQGGI